MSLLGRFLRARRDREYLRGRPEDLWRTLIARYAPGKTFVDVGCMWRVNGAYAFLALQHGATKVVGVDVEPATTEFLAENARVDDAVRFIQGDLNDPAIDTLGGGGSTWCSAPACSTTCRIRSSH